MDTKAENTVQYIARIDLTKYRAVSADVATDRLVLTENQRKHIIDRRGEAFFKAFFPYFQEIAENPDYIFCDRKRENTAIASKTLEMNGQHVNLVIRLAVASDEGKENSIITAIAENDKRYAQRLRNNMPLYKRE